MVLHLIQFVPPEGEGEPEIQVLTTEQWESWLEYARRKGVNTHKKIKEVTLTSEEAAEIDPRVMGP